MKFAKLFETSDDSQVLLTMGFNDEQQVPQITIRTDVEGVTATINLSFDNEEKAEQAINDYNQESAEDFRKNMVEMFNPTQ